jgi:hypothetical protein
MRKPYVKTVWIKGADQPIYYVHWYKNGAHKRSSHTSIESAEAQRKALAKCGYLGDK